MLNKPLGAPPVQYLVREDGQRTGVVLRWEDYQTLLTTATYSLPSLRRLPASWPVENAIRIDMEDDTPVMRASGAVQSRIEELLLKQHASQLTAVEEELDRYEEINDYISFLNCIVRNLRNSSRELSVSPQTA
jgi:hypothetical protein